MNGRGRDPVIRPIDNINDILASFFNPAKNNIYLSQMTLFLYNYFYHKVGGLTY